MVEVQQDNNERNNSFHFLRFLAASFVIITHSYVLLGLPEHDLMVRLTNGTTSFSRLGVWIFFVISGYLIMGSAERSKTVVSYVFRRVLRIFPALIVVVLVTVFVLGSIVSTLPVDSYLQDHMSWRYLLAITLYRVQYHLPGVFSGLPYPHVVNGSLWTIPYEFTLYALPMLLVLGQKWSRVFPWRGLLVAFVLLVIFTRAAWSGLFYVIVPVLGLNAWHLLNFSVFFVAGMLVHLYKQSIPMKPYLAWITLSLWLVSCWIGFGPYVSYVAIPYLVLFIAERRSWLNNFGKFGDVSYGVYLYAFPLGQLIVSVAGIHLSVPTLAIATWISAIVCGYLSWKIIEAPALRFKKTFVSFSSIV